MKIFRIGLLIIAMLWGSVASWGSEYSFKVDGICYKYNSDSTVYVTRGDMTYSGDISIPESVTYKRVTYTVTGIGGWTFDDCRNITSVKLPSTITAIGKRAFCNSSIKSITLPKSLKHIEDNAFSSCELLKEIFLLGDEYPTVFTYSFEYYKHPERKFYVKDKDKCCKDKNWEYYKGEIVQYITFDNNNEFTYTGQVPEISYTNNLTLYELDMQVEGMQKDAGTHTVNFRAQYSNGLELNFPYTYTINRASLNIEIHDIEKFYGDPNPSFTYTLSGFVNNEDESVFRTPLQWSVDCFQDSDVGLYPIRLNTEDYAENYTLNILRTGNLSVKKAPVLVKMNDQTRLYGDTNPQFTLSFEGLKNDDTTPDLSADFKISTTATAESEVGMYDVRVSGGQSKNYEFREFQGGKLFVTPAPLIIEAQSSTRTYGSENAPFKFIYSGFKNSDTATSLTRLPEATTDATATSDAGSYSITPYGAEAKNYNISYKNGTLTVQKATLLATVGNVSRTYGEKNPEFTVTYSGFVNQEDESEILIRPQFNCKAGQWTDVGSYPIVASGAEATNYTFNYQNGVLTIGKATQEILWEQDLTDIRTGTQVELMATATSGLPIEYELGANDVASIYEANGTYYLDCFGMGEVYIKAKQQGNQNYYSAVRVSKKLIVGDGSSVGAVNGDVPLITVDKRTIQVNGAKAQIQIYDTTGKLVKNVSPTGKLTLIEMAKPGIFIVRTQAMSSKVVLR